MRKHILSKFSSCHEYKGENTNYYDEVTQVSYRDKQFRKKIINICDETIITETIETQDQDEFEYKMSTKVSFTIEDSDEDEVYTMGRSTETRVIENSDPDEFVC